MNYPQVMVLMPSEKAVPFKMKPILSGNSDLGPFATNLLERYLQDPSDDLRRRDVRALVRRVVTREIKNQQPGGRRFSPKDLAHVVACCSSTDDHESFSELVEAMKDPLLVSTFEELGESMHRHAFPHFRQG